MIVAFLIVGLCTAATVIAPPTGPSRYESRAQPPAATSNQVSAVRILEHLLVSQLQPRVDAAPGDLRAERELAETVRRLAMHYTDWGNSLYLAAYPRWLAAKDACTAHDGCDPAGVPSGLGEARDKVAQAVDAYQFFRARWPEDPHTPEVSLELARLMEQEARWLEEEGLPERAAAQRARAIGHYHGIVRDAPMSEVAPAALYQLAMWHWARDPEPGALDQARTGLLKAASYPMVYPGSLAVMDASLQGSRVLRAQERTAEALELLLAAVEAVREDPTLLGVPEGAAFLPSEHLNEEVVQLSLCWGDLQRHDAAWLWLDGLGDPVMAFKGYRWLAEHLPKDLAPQSDQEVAVAHRAYTALFHRFPLHPEATIVRRDLARRMFGSAQYDLAVEALEEMAGLLATGSHWSQEHPDLVENNRKELMAELAVEVGGLSALAVDPHTTAPMARRHRERMRMLLSVGVGVAPPGREHLVLLNDLALVQVELGEWQRGAEAAQAAAQGLASLGDPLAADAAATWLAAADRWVAADRTLVPVVPRAEGAAPIPEPLREAEAAKLAATGAWFDSRPALGPASFEPAFFAGLVLYERQHLAASRPWFRRALTAHPTAPRAAEAAEYLLLSFNPGREWGALLEETEALYAGFLTTNPDVADEIARARDDARYWQMADLALIPPAAEAGATQAAWRSSADQFAGFAERYPSSQWWLASLRNAARASHFAGDFGRAMAYRVAYLERESDPVLVREQRSALAAELEDTAQYSPAVELWLGLARGHSDPVLAARAQYRAANLTDALGQHRRAGKMMEALLERYPTSPGALAARLERALQGMDRTELRAARRAAVEAVEAGRAPAEGLSDLVALAQLKVIYLSEPEPPDLAALAGRPESATYRELRERGQALVELGLAYRSLIEDPSIGGGQDARVLAAIQQARLLEEWSHQLGDAPVPRALDAAQAALYSQAMSDEIAEQHLRALTLAQRAQALALATDTYPPELASIAPIAGPWTSAPPLAGLPLAGTGLPGRFRGADDALEVARASLLSQGGDAAVLGALARTLLGQGHTALAAWILEEQVIGKAGVRAVDLVNYAAATCKLARYAECGSAMRRAQALEPSLAEANTGLGLLLMRAGELDEAAKLLSRGGSRDPDVLRAQSALSAVLAQRAKDSATAQARQAEATRDMAATERRGIFAARMLLAQQDAQPCSNGDESLRDALATLREQVEAGDGAGALETVPMVEEYLSELSCP
jgi:hypothetical protein